MSRSRNSEKIHRAFARLQRNKDIYLENCMAAIMEEAMQFAMEIHALDDKHPYHLVRSGDYFWNLTHNGQMIDSEIHRTSDTSGANMAEDKISDYVKNSVKNGWQGTLVAGMTTAHKPAYENYVLRTVGSEAMVSFRKELLDMKL